MTDQATPPSPVRDLRDAFGDSKPPDISRKITACVACRKQKIKCHMPGPKPPCSRCKKRGLSCTVNRSLQMLLEGDSLWKDAIEKKLQALQDAVGHISDRFAVEEISSQNDLPGLVSRNVIVGQVSSEQSPSQISPRQNHWNVVLDPNSGPGAVPGSCIARTSPSPASMRPCDQDLISKEIIRLEDAKLYFNHYTECLDHFVYRILGSGNTVTFEDTRKSSPLLIAAICTVGALHFTTRERDFDLCRNEFVTLCAKSSLSQANDIADVRALCIGAFWLPDLSWPLSTAAVRIATELQLHKSFYQSTHDHCYQHYIRTRLYYHVYACDHHASIPFGRPPLTRECEAIRDSRKFLSIESATEDDARLVSQVCRWSVLSNIYDAFGVDVGRHLTDIEIPSLRKFNFELDSLRAEWVDRFVPNAHVGNYPRKGVGLQYHFAKLYLCSHAFRGADYHDNKGPSSRISDLAMELDEIANIAVLSAVSILRSVRADLEIQSFLDGLPAYFHVMVTFAVIFLLKVSTKPSYYIQLDAKEVKNLVSETVTTLNRLTSNMHPRHLLVNIARGLENLLQQSGSGEPRNPASSAPDVFLRAPEIDLWNDGTFDPYFLGTYDFYTDFDATPENMALLQ